MVAETPIVHVPTNDDDSINKPNMPDIPYIPCEIATKEDKEEKVTETAGETEEKSDGNGSIECGLCMLDKTIETEFDVVCGVCKYFMCYECMFEYIKHNRNKDKLLCPHCRQDLLQEASLSFDSDASLLSVYLVQKEIEEMEKLYQTYLDSSDDDYNSSDEPDSSDESDSSITTSSSGSTEYDGDTDEESDEDDNDTSDSEVSEVSE